ncbi:hypothetical protein [Pseudomonas sp. 22 E 5]|nr:hypothetical protein [Pseudomonas sp. 22 E 5]
MANIGAFTADKDGLTDTLHTMPLNINVKRTPNHMGDNQSATDYCPPRPAIATGRFVLISSCCQTAHYRYIKAQREANHSSELARQPSAQPLAAYTRPDPRNHQSKSCRLYLHDRSA